MPIKDGLSADETVSNLSGIPVNVRQQFIELFAKPIEDVCLAYIVDAADVYT